MFKRELAKRNKLLGIRRERAHPKFSPVTIVMLIVLILYVASLFLLFFLGGPDGVQRSVA